ncbi:sensor histidine kinase [Lederbergia wuyishanensis]|uniref:histidine kinase n=1 Tax=Lederbergia wuyishanensis TaxID=1347903 RepID=A0ABU0DA89_9BACI|nr:HAMP domain-containing sensor histidine kinase [Lederbergia wuyishanensis]MCJ8009967.1 HAMP domain-containing histidine kinase [Lederbergia wuyishanensis]MDQ0345315.1 signal transduction histidine kinase [Lederbergia wuyishanensis]
MKNGIKRRLVWSYLLLIIFTVALFETIILSALMVYYKGGVQQTLRDQGAMFAAFYEQELLEGRFEKEAEQFLTQYNFLVNVQVQLIDKEGKILAETHKSHLKSLNQEEDVLIGLTGTSSHWTGQMNGEKVMAVTYPLKAGDEIKGAIRLTTSLAPLNSVFTENALLLLAIGGIVVVLAAVISFFLAGTITKPVSHIITAAEQMAAGKFSTRISKKQDDELGKLADTLNYMAEQVEKHEQLKNEFIASISHDLRTPLTSVKGWAITLQSMATDDLFKEGLDIITNESDRLTSLVSDLLDLSSLSSGKLSFVFDDVYLPAIVKKVVSQLQPRAERNGVQILTDIHPSIGEIKADKNRLIQVFINVMDNALKFTPKDGTISISVSEGNGDSVVINIKDTGVGIPKNKLENIKEKFVKGKTQESGTGLGLAICEEIIKGHHGTLHIDSHSDEGTTVRIVLPVTFM